MTHGDEKGLRLPPNIAPHQVVLVPIFKNEDEMNAIKDYINPVLNELRESRIRVHEDWRKESPGFKFNEWEVKGAPLRLEIGLRDIQKNSTMVFRRDTGEKNEVDKNDLV